uniref:Uncharacterized protein n=1 Tax=Sphaerodactylus townsendi TaxID=933632 RepID=A0ACB8GAU4_9SAUR
MCSLEAELLYENGLLLRVQPNESHNWIVLPSVRNLPGQNRLARMELAEALRVLKMTKQQLQEECQKQNIECENKSVDEMKVLLVRNGMAARTASALTTQGSPNPKDEVRLQELELEKLQLQAWKEIELQRLRMQEEQRKEEQRKEDREAHRTELEREEELLERKEKMQEEQRKLNLEMLHLQAEHSRKIKLTPKDFAPYREGENPSIYRKF